MSKARTRVSESLGLRQEAGKEELEAEVSGTHFGGLWVLRAGAAGHTATI